jgi:hypothetical protein
MNEIDTIVCLTHLNNSRTLNLGLIHANFRGGFFHNDNNNNNFIPRVTMTIQRNVTLHNSQETNLS